MGRATFVVRPFWVKAVKAVKPNTTRRPRTASKPRIASKSRVKSKSRVTSKWRIAPNRLLEPVQILCMVEHIACLALEGVAGYVKRKRQARCRQANER